jgi:hypothetical protein
MVWFAQKKMPCLILTAYIALSVMGAFSFAAADALRSVNFKAETLMPGRVSDSMDNYFIRHPAEEPVVITKTDNTQIFPLRVGFQRVVSLFGPSAIGNASSKSPFRTGVKIPYTNTKKIILLKLRI